MKIQVLFFGMAKDLVDKSNITLEFDEEISVELLREFLAKKYPSFSKLDSFAVAVNESYAEEEFVLSDNDTVAIIPPVSGG